MREYDYKSSFAFYIKDYIAEMRAIGYKFEWGAEDLFRFDRFCCEERHVGADLYRDIVEAWGKRRPHESIRRQAGRISCVRGLAHYITKIGGNAYIAPRTGSAIKRYAYQPHIYTSDEIRRLLIACDLTAPCPVSPRRYIVMPMAIRLIYGCALRISEARHLEVRDVDLKDATLTIRHTKFGKSRIVPIAEGLAEKCRSYYREVLQGKSDQYPFLPSHKGSFYSSDAIYEFFRQALHRAGIPHTGDGPRIHDLRHTAACRCLSRWVQDGRDITNCLPYLSAYLGHEDLRGTQHYLRLTAEMHPELIDATEKGCSWMIPEVMSYETD